MDKRDSISKIPFVLVTGFLGSGKTTLLKQFLNRFADSRRIAVIQNEFANANVDGQTLKRTGKTVKILEINKGSVFCVCLLSGFVQSLVDLVDNYRPDVIVLEATGLADPITIGQLLCSDPLKVKLYLAQVWCVVDVSTFLELEPRVQRMSQQIRIADRVILNKTDQSESKQLDSVKKRVLALNPHADLLQTQFCRLPDSFSENHFWKISERNQGQPIENSAVFSGRPSIASAVLRTTRFISREALELFLHRFEQTVYRIKGYVNLSDHTTLSVQSCFGKTAFKLIDKESGPTELIALGPDLNQEKFISDFNLLATSN